MYAKKQKLSVIPLIFASEGMDTVPRFFFYNVFYYGWNEIFLGFPLSAQTLG